MKLFTKWFLLVVVCLSLFTPALAWACHWGDCYEEYYYEEVIVYDDYDWYYPSRYFGGIGGCDIEIDD